MICTCFPSTQWGAELKQSSRVDTEVKVANLGGASAKCQKWPLTQNHDCSRQGIAWRVLPQLATWRKQNVHLPSTVSWIQPCWEVGLEALISGLIVEPSDEESSALSLGFQMGSWMSHLDAVVVPPSLVPTLCTGTSLCTQSWYLLLYSLVVPSMFGTK